LKYNIGDGIDDGSYADRTKLDWNEAGLFPGEPKKPGHAFTWWTTNSNGSGNRLVNDTKYSALADNKEPSNNILTVYAQYEELKDHYTIIYNPNGGVSSDVTSSGLLDWSEPNIIPAADKNPTRAGWTFTGWNVDPTPADPAKGVVNANTKVSDIGGNGETAQITIYAQWEAKPQYTVKYVSNGDTNPADLTGKKWTDKGLIPTGNAKPTKQGFTFLNWETANGVTVDEDTLYSAIAGGIEPTDPITGNKTYTVTIYGVWEEGTNYTVSYNAKSGSPTPNAKTVAYTLDGALLPASNPTRIGYAFDAWYTLDGGPSVAGNKKIDSTVAYEDCVANDKVMSITLYANWIPNSGKKVIYDYDGGNLNSNLGPFEYTQDAQGVLVNWETTGLDSAAAAPTKAGYTFKGWTDTYNTKSLIASGTKYGTIADKQQNGVDATSITLYAYCEEKVGN
jgi:uncharacterized repeat protein (TIGR02543 family)